MNIKNTVLITLALGLALSTGINFCSQEGDLYSSGSELEPIYRSQSDIDTNARLQQQMKVARRATVEEPDNSYFGWRSKAATLRQKLFGSPYPMEGARMGAAISTAYAALAAGAALLVEHIHRLNYGFRGVSNREASRFVSDLASAVALPAIVATTVAGVALGLMKQNKIDAAQALREAGKKEFPKVMPLIKSNMNKLMNEAAKIYTFEKYEASPYKNVFKQIGDLKFQETTPVTE